MQKRESFTINEQGLGISKNELFIILVLQMGVLYDCEYHPCVSCVLLGGGEGKKVRLVYLSGGHHKMSGQTLTYASCLTLHTLPYQVS